MREAQTGWSFRVPFTELLPDLFQYAFNIPINSLVFKSNYPDSSLLQILRSPGVVLTSAGTEVGCAVQFDNDAFFRTKKVDNVRTNATLSSKFLPIELGAFQMSPQHRLRSS